MNAIAYVNEYASYMTDIDRKSKNTVESYRRDIIQYITYLNNAGINEVTAATRANVLTYLITLQKNGKAPSTVSRTLASLKSFYLYLIGQGTAQLDPTVNLETPKPPKKAPQVLSLEEVGALLDAPSASDNKGLRDKAMLELMYATGIRASELINLNLSDVNLPMNFIYCKGAKKDRVIPFGKAAGRSLEIYISRVRNEILKNSTEQSLFVNLNGTRLTRQGFWKIIKQYGKSANIETELTPHILRHSFAAHLVRNGADLDSIKEMMGHSDIASTKIYARFIDPNLRSVYDKAHPRS